MDGKACVAVVGPDSLLAEGSSDERVIWWSFTKTLIAAAAFRFAEEEQLPLDQPVEGRAYTLRHLLQHRAGVGDYGRLQLYHDAVAAGDPPWSDEQLFAHVPPDRTAFQPGGGFAYSNVGYLIARRLIEDACGAGLGQALEDLVLAPLQIEGARLALTPADLAETALPPPAGYHPGWVFHGAVVGPASAAALALHRLLESPLLSPASRAGMLEGGAGLMMRTLTGPGSIRPRSIVGHSAAGPGSVGAVYSVASGGPRVTAAAFVSGEDQQEAEVLAGARLLRS